MRRGFRVRPVSSPHPEAADVVRRHPADHAVEDDALEFALKIALHAQQLGSGLAMLSLFVDAAWERLKK
jgi:hypothetical protein